MKSRLFDALLYLSANSCFSRLHFSHSKGSSHSPQSVRRYSVAKSIVKFISLSRISPESHLHSHFDESARYETCYGNCLPVCSK